MTIPKRTLKLMNFFNIDFYYGLLHGDVRKNYSPGNFLLRSLGIIVISIHRFVKDACFVSASAMTFYSILSFIPLVALIFGIGKGFGFEFLLEDFVRSKLYLNVDVADFIIGSAQKALENARGGVVTGFGIVLLLWAVIKLLTNAETAINNVWRVTSSRSVARRFTDYFSIMFVVPVLLLLILSINVFMTTNLKQLIAEGGMIYLRLDRLDSATLCFREAAGMTPNHILPVYGLWSVARIRGDTVKCRMLSEKILSMPVRVKNSAVFRARKSVREYLSGE